MATESKNPKRKSSAHVGHGLLDLWFDCLYIGIRRLNYEGGFRFVPLQQDIRSTKKVSEDDKEIVFEMNTVFDHLCKFKFTTKISGRFDLKGHAKLVAKVDKTTGNMMVDIVSQELTPLNASFRTDAYKILLEGYTVQASRVNLKKAA